MRQFDKSLSNSKWYLVCAQASVTLSKALTGGNVTLTQMLNLFEHRLSAESRRKAGLAHTLLCLSHPREEWTATEDSQARRTPPVRPPRHPTCFSSTGNPLITRVRARAQIKEI